MEIPIHVSNFIYSVDVFNFLQPVLENNSNNEMSVAKIVETCRQEVRCREN